MNLRDRCAVICYSALMFLDLRWGAQTVLVLCGLVGTGAGCGLADPCYACYTDDFGTGGKNTGGSDIALPPSQSTGGTIEGGASMGGGDVEGGANMGGRAEGGAAGKEATPD